MTAPTDLDVDDRALEGEDDMFDLGQGEKEMSRRKIGKKALGDVIRDQEAEGSDEEGEEGAESSEEEIDFEDSEEEREYRTQELEGELDELYDQYKDRMSERDAKWKVKQARLKDKNYDAWHGIGKAGSDADSDEEAGDRMVKRIPRRGDNEEEDDGEESEEGGWDRVAARKAAIGEDDSGSDSDSDVDTKAKPRTAKAGPSTRAVREPKQTPRALVTSLQDREQRAQMSRQAQLWFDQSVFKGMGDLAALDGDEEEEEEEEDEKADEEDEEDDGVDEDGDVAMGDAPSLSDADDDTVSRSLFTSQKDAELTCSPRTTTLRSCPKPSMTTAQSGTWTMKTKMRSSGSSSRVCYFSEQ